MWFTSCAIGTSPIGTSPKMSRTLLALWPGSRVAPRASGRCSTPTATGSRKMQSSWGMEIIGKWWENHGEFPRENGISSDAVKIRLANLVQQWRHFWLKFTISSPGRAWEKDGKGEKSAGLAVQADLLLHSLRPLWILATYQPNHCTIRARSLFLKSSVAKSQNHDNEQQNNLRHSATGGSSYAMLCGYSMDLSILSQAMTESQSESKKKSHDSSWFQALPSDIHPCIQLVGWHEVELHDQMVTCKDHVVAHPPGWTFGRIPGQRVAHLHWMLHVPCPHSPWMVRPNKGATQIPMKNMTAIDS